MSLPAILNHDGQLQKLEKLQRFHSEFNEALLQELLADHPELLPVEKIRKDAGKLLPVGREVYLEGCGNIDNLYLSTGGYPVIVETKLWRNPQARREVLSQVLDYTKELVKKDFEWFEKVWAGNRNKNSDNSLTLMDNLIQLSDEELYESEYIDRLHGALLNGDILSLIVGDGIETRLQKLVSHLCEDSAHLRYSLALIELSCFKIDRDVSGHSEMLIIPKIIQEIEPVQRAYVRIEIPSDYKSEIKIESVANEETTSKKGYIRNNLKEDDFIKSLDAAIGIQARRKIEEFYHDIVNECELEADFKAATLMIKVPDPMDEKPSVSILAIERQGRIYNTKHMLNQLKGWGFTPEQVDEIASEYWGALNKIDQRFLEDGLIHNSPKQFLPIIDLVEHFEEIGEAVRRVVDKIRSLKDS